MSEFFGKLNKELAEIRDQFIWDWFTSESFYYKFLKERDMIKTIIICDHCGKEVDNFKVFMTLILNDNVNHKYQFCDKRCLRRWAKNTGGVYD